MKTSTSLADEARAHFKDDVRNHRMKIIHDDGLHRHIQFRAPNTSNRYFNLTTWPGYLAISGDCNDLMFSRLADMFDFFRGDVNGPIDYRYWMRKAVAISKSGGVNVFSEDRFREAVRHDLAMHVAGMPLSDAKTVILDARDGLLNAHPYDKMEAIEIAANWKCPVSGEYPLQEFWDHNLMEPAYGFVWACHAIRWGIKRYDLHKAGRSQVDHDSLVLAGAK